MWTREELAERNKVARIDLYKTGAFWAAFGAITPMAFFLNHNILRTPEPIGRTFTGYQREQVPMGDYYETYNYHYASPGDEWQNVMGFILGIFAAVAVAFLFYCIARYIADPIMYRIDLRTEQYSNTQRWLKRIVMVCVVLLYCGSMVFAYEYDAHPEDQRVWLSDGKGNEFSVPLEEYEKYMKDAEKQKNTETTTTTQPATEPTTQPATEPTEPTEDRSKTPVERGYPSNDVDYYIDHPDEPMPPELIEELVGPELYDDVPPWY